MKRYFALWLDRGGSEMSCDHLHRDPDVAQRCADKVDPADTFYGDGAQVFCADGYYRDGWAHCAPEYQMCNCGSPGYWHTADSDSCNRELG